MVVAAAVCIGVGGFDLGGVNVVLPRMADSFAVSPGAIQWVSIAYLLPIAALALPVGRWLDTVGRRGAILLLLCGFTACSAAAGSSSSLVALIASRFVQGAFGAGLFAVTPVLAYEAVEPDRRVRALAAISTIGALGGVAGPSLGAAVTQAAGWPWIFWLNVPVLLVMALVLAIRIPAGLPLHLPSKRFASEAVLLTAAAAALLVALTVGAQRGPGWFLLALLAPPAIVAWVRLHPESPVLQLARRPGFTWAVGSLALLAASGLAVQLLLAFLAERELHLSAAETGTALLFVAAATAPAAAVAGRLSSRLRLERVSAAGFALVAVGTVAATALRAPGALPLAGLALVIGAGQGLANTPATAISFSFSSASTMASAGASISFLRNIGFTAGPAVATSIWSLCGYSAAGLRVALVAVALLAAAGAFAVLRSGVGHRMNSGADPS